jgi:hypothetical protein
MKLIQADAVRFRHIQITIDDAPDVEESYSLGCVLRIPKPWPFFEIECLRQRDRRPALRNLAEFLTFRTSV